MLDKDVCLLILVCILFPFAISLSISWITSKAEHTSPKAFFLIHSATRVISAMSGSDHCHFPVMAVPAPSTESVCDTAFCTSHRLTPNCLDHGGHFSYTAGVLVFLGHALCFNASVCLVPLFPWKTLLPVPPSLKSRMPGPSQPSQEELFLSRLDS